MFCRYCGREIDDNASFCPYCGKDQKGSSENESRSDAGKAQTSYQQRNIENAQGKEAAQMDKVLAENFDIGSGSGVIMKTRFHAAMRFRASILVIITGVFFLVMSFIVLVSYRAPWVIYVISWILIVAALIYFYRCTQRITRAVFAVTDTQLLIYTWRPSQKLTIPLDQIDEMNMQIVPFYRNEYGDLHLSVNGQKYFFHQIYKPKEFRDALANQMNKVKQ